MKITKKLNVYKIDNIKLHDIPIGETFIIDNEKYIVVEKALFCIDCDCKFDICNSLECSRDYRKDKKYVSFKRL